MATDDLDIDGFRRWALGELRDNRNRGVFAEWLVGKALGAIDDEATRLEWMPWDLEYREMTIEVKATGQAWAAQPRPRFDIAPRRRTWLASTDEWIENDPPARPADVYVFCLHTSEVATNENVMSVRGREDGCSRMETRHCYEPVPVVSRARLPVFVRSARLVSNLVLTLFVTV